MNRIATPLPGDADDLIDVEICCRAAATQRNRFIRVWRASTSSSEYTATVEMPSSAAARRIRTAISPRLATSRRLIIVLRSLPAAALIACHAGVRSCCVGQSLP
jgi:hypothetical protein